LLIIGWLWFSYLVRYIKDHNIIWCYWALNGTQSEAPGRDPSQPDWHGVLDPAWNGSASPYPPSYVGRKAFDTRLCEP
jgi:hypothetical protein